MAVSVRCIKTGTTGDREAQPISDPMVTTPAIARSRGTRFLNDPGQGSYYRVRTRTMKIPHLNNAIIPRAGVTVTCPELELTATLVKVKAYKLEITRRGLFGELTTQEFIEP